MEYKDNITADDLFGRFYIAIPNLERYNSYYSALKKLLPFLNSNTVRKCLTGFYINAHKSVGVRLSYFAVNGQEGYFRTSMRDFLKKNNLLEICEEEKPHVKVISKSYGGPLFEIPFRRFLNLISRIAVELLMADRDHAKSLALTYRWQVFPSKLFAGEDFKISVKQHFQASFEKYSKTFCSLSKSQREQLWADLIFWPDNPDGKDKNYDWAHFLIEPTVILDVPPRGASCCKSIPEINEFYRRKCPDFDFQIRLEWKCSSLE